MTVPKFGDLPADQLEQVDEVRLYPVGNPAPVPLEPGDLPVSYGRNRLVLLPVDPYLIHVYWDLSSTTPPAPGVRPVLRFHESSPGIDETRPFDVDIDFSTSSWYVNLWSPDKLYYADLGWRGEDGSFVGLVRSNTVRTPPAWPRPAEPVVSVEHAATAASVAPDIEPEPIPAVRVEPPRVEPPRGEPSRMALPDLLQRRLAELYAIRGELPPVHEPIPIDWAMPAGLEGSASPEEIARQEMPGEEIPGEPSELGAILPSPWSELEGLDLTQLSEERFTPGISSDLEGSFGK